MKLQLVRRGVTFDDDFRRFIDEKVDATLRRFSSKIGWVRILLEDTNGPRGGIDKRCTVSVGGARLETQIVEARDSRLHAALSRALHIANRALVRTLSRER